MSEQEQILQRQIERARVVPDVGGGDIVGGAVLFLANGQPVLPARQSERAYFVR